MLIKDREITETEILNVINERKNRKNVKDYTFEDAYEIGLNYIPKI